MPKRVFQARSDADFRPVEPRSGGDVMLQVLPDSSPAMVGSFVEPSSAAQPKLPGPYVDDEPDGDEIQSPTLYGAADAGLHTNTGIAQVVCPAPTVAIALAATCAAFATCRPGIVLSTSMNQCAMLLNCAVHFTYLTFAGVATAVLVRNGLVSESLNVTFESVCICTAFC